MRGEHSDLRTQRNESTGIIPACAGSTALILAELGARLGSSPHARGAPRCRISKTHTKGDHPRMRGEHVLVGAPRPVQRGIIPACAGSTLRYRHCQAWSQGSSPHARGALINHQITTLCVEDHPRMRGEHMQTATSFSASLGIIPACAGSTPGMRESRDGFLGSSPHARGARCSQRMNPR